MVEMLRLYGAAEKRKKHRETTAPPMTKKQGGGKFQADLKQRFTPSLYPRSVSDLLRGKRLSKWNKSG